MKISIYLLLIACVNSQSYDLFHNSPVGGSLSIDTFDGCEDITPSRMCSSMPWNKTTFPNILNHANAQGKLLQSKDVMY